MTATLDQQLADLARIHGLDAISVGVNVVDGRPVMSAAVHRNGKCAGDRLYGDDLTAAFKDAIARLNEFEVPAFAPMSVVA